MRPHVSDLNAFYDHRLGQVARRMIRRRVREIWPDVRGMVVLGLGFATPYLRPFRDEAERVLAFMPAGQGVLHWPREAPNQVALVDETELPLGDVSVDRVLLVHALENSEELRALLREVWRVMASGGRLMVVVPNRRGIWARFERTPFGHGYPFSPPQLSRLLRENLFSPLRSSAALYVPPTDWRMMLRAAPAWEKLGDRFGQPVAGVLMVEAVKEIYAVTPRAVAKRAKRKLRPVVVPGGMAGHHARGPVSDENA